MLNEFLWHDIGLIMYPFVSTKAKSPGYHKENFESLHIFTLSQCSSHLDDRHVSSKVVNYRQASTPHIPHRLTKH